MSAEKGGSIFLYSKVKYCKKTFMNNKPSIYIKYKYNHLRVHYNGDLIYMYWV